MKKGIVLLLCSRYCASLAMNASALEFGLNGFFFVVAVVTIFIFESTTDNATRYFKCL